MFRKFFWVIIWYMPRCFFANIFFFKFHRWRHNYIETSFYGLKWKNCYFLVQQKNNQIMKSIRNRLKNKQKIIHEALQVLSSKVSLIRGKSGMFKMFQFWIVAWHQKYKPFALKWLNYINLSMLKSRRLSQGEDQINGLRKCFSHSSISTRISSLMKFHLVSLLMV